MNAAGDDGSLARLAGSQAMLFSVTSTLVAVNGLVGLALAPSAALATLPASCVVLGTLAATLPASLYMRHTGRRTGLVHGALIGVVAAAACALAVRLGSFWLLCTGALAFGAFNAFGQYYRFAAADAVPAAARGTAVSLVLAGGLVGGLIGPAASRLTIDALEPRFAGAYLSLALFALAAAALLRRGRLAEPPPEKASGPGRRFAEVAAQPRYRVAVLAGAVGYGVMSLVMTATPIAMHACGHSYGDAAFVISSHVVAMFAPSLATGVLLRRFGVLPVLLVGVLLNLGAVGVAVSGNQVREFWWALVLLGVGWNFLYVGGTTLLADTYRPQERAIAQGANELAVFLTQALASLAAGGIVAAGGWREVNLAALPALAAVAGAAAWLALKERLRAPAHAERG
ncbi:MAG TPA: MFS transporter [Burkholderiales bacterium]|nr:MFS transporter [Burkholderiales bacterium]